MSEIIKIPDGWLETTLREVIETANTGLDAIKRAPIVNEETGIKCFRIQDASQKKKYKNWGNTLVEEKNYKRFQLIKGDILIARTGNTIGVNYLVKKNLKSVFNNGLIRLRVNENIDYRYLYKIIESKVFDRYIQSIAYGTSTQPNMQINVLLGFEFLLPSIPEQKSIAQILTSFDDKIELLQAQNKTLETLAQNIFSEWFGKYQIGDELPDGWRIGKLSEIANHRKTSIKPFNNPEAEYYHYSLPSYDNGLIPVIEKGEMIRSNKYLVENNSFLVSKLNPFTPRIWTIFDSLQNFICSTEFQVVKPKEELFFSLIHCFLNSDEFTSELSQKIKGTSSSHQRVNPQDIFDVELVIPTENDLINFNAAIYPLLAKKNINLKQIQTLSKTRDELLPRLMSGELRVKM